MGDVAVIRDGDRRVRGQVGPGRSRYMKLCSFDELRVELCQPFKRRDQRHVRPCKWVEPACCPTQQGSPRALFTVPAGKNLTGTAERPSWSAMTMRTSEGGMI